MSWLVQEAISEKTFLDIGCGTGAFTIEALKNGASYGVGIDLSPTMIKTAQEFAEESGLRSRSKFELGNASTTDLPFSDVAILDKVICCYPEADSLISNAAKASRESIGFVAPKDSGVVGSLLRFGAFLMNIIEMRRSKGMPFYIHSIKSVERILREGGFVRKKKTGSRIWTVLVYIRAKPTG